MVELRASAKEAANLVDEAVVPAPLVRRERLGFHALLCGGEDRLQSFSLFVRRSAPRDQCAQLVGAQHALGTVPKFKELAELLGRIGCHVSIIVGLVSRRAPNGG